MALKLVVAVTDSDWHNFLSQESSLSEVNFWSPSGVNFKALQPGELFLFKLKAPKNYIVGCGVFARSTNLPCSLAWEAFGRSNGASSAQEMRARIAKYRKAEAGDRSDFVIGCRILTQPCFFPEELWLPVPPSWSGNIVSFKTYTTDESDGRALWEAVDERMNYQPIAGVAEPMSRFGGPQLIRPRLGQGAFRIAITELYNRRCAITHEKTLPALEAAHIRPYSEGGTHNENNGLLLRRDVHSLFDTGYVTVTPDFHFEVSSKIREEFENGRHYYALHGSKILLPNDPAALPDKSALTWHNEERFKG